METQAPDVRQEVLRTLKYVIDPEIGLNIVDLGLVYEIRLQAEELTVALTLTTPGCPMGGTILRSAEQILLKKYPHLQVRVELVWEPAWSAGNITEEGLRQLNSH